MKYIEGMDYWVRYLPFPNMASESVAVSHGDGTFTIYINTLFPEERQQERLRHELRHLTEEHFYRDDLSIRQIEHQADGVSCACTAAQGLPDAEPPYPAEPAADCRTLPGPAPSFVAVRSDALGEDVSFAFRVPDDSLLPHFSQGQLLYCDDRPLTPGDVGLFQYRGVTMCRQYQRDAFGITYLFSLNRSRSREDIPIPAGSVGELLCLGRVRTETPIPLPGR